MLSAAVAELEFSSHLEPNLGPDEHSALLSALHAARTAYTPYSKRPCGICLLFADGWVFVQSHPVPPSPVQSRSVPPSATPPHPASPNSAEPSPAQPNLAQPSLTQPSPAQPSPAPFRVWLSVRYDDTWLLHRYPAVDKMYRSQTDVHK